MHRRLALGVAVVVTGSGLWGLGVGPAGATESQAAPVAVPDTYTTKEGVQLIVEEPGVLENDTDADGDYLEAIYVAGPKMGALRIASDGHFIYTPPAGWHGTDEFTYKADDDEAVSNVATVKIVVTPGANTAPKAVADAYRVDQGGTLTKEKPGFLANDTDAEGDPLFATLAGNPKHGSVKIASDGSFTYTPLPTFSGTDSFGYKVNDGEADSAPATVTITVEPKSSGSGSGTGTGSGSGTGTGSGTGRPSIGGGTTAAPRDPLGYCRPGAPRPSGYKVIKGTSGKNNLKGTKGKDLILAGGGNDTVSAGGGNDIICGGDGNDTLRGGDGKDKISGGAGNDTLYGDGANDNLYGGAGADRISGGAGSDIVRK